MSTSSALQNVKSEKRLKSWDKIGRLQRAYRNELINNSYKRPLDRANFLHDLRQEAGHLLIQQVHDVRIGALESGNPNAPHSKPTNASLSQSLRAPSTDNHGGRALDRAVQRRVAQQVFHQKQKEAIIAQQRQRRHRIYKQFQQQQRLTVSSKSTSS